MSISGPERLERIRIVLRKLSIEQILTHYGIEFGMPKESRKGGLEYSFSCPFHTCSSVNFSMNSESSGFICRSSFCGKRGDLIRFISLHEHCSDETAYAFLCEMAGIQSTDFSELAIAVSCFDAIGRRPELKPLKPEPIAWPDKYEVLAHPYLVKARGLEPKVLLEAKAGHVPEDSFYRYRACVPIQVKGKLYSLYSRATASRQAWQRRYQDKADRVDQMYPTHHYTGASLTSRLLFGIDEAVACGRREVILVEAVISTLKLRGFNYPQATGMLKAGVSRDQVRLLLHRADAIDRVIICSDNDSMEDPDTGESLNPGRKAAWMSYKMLRDFFDVGIATLPENVDPADMDEKEDFDPVYENVFWPQRKKRDRDQAQAFMRGEV
jgi:hypothetical protein